jgi:hypothetical protein
VHGDTHTASQAHLAACVASRRRRAASFSFLRSSASAWNFSICSAMLVSSLQHGRQVHAMNERISYTLCVDTKRPRRVEGCEGGGHGRQHNTQGKQPVSAQPCNRVDISICSAILVSSPQHSSQMHAMDG